MKLDRETRIRIQEQINKSKIDKENKDIINRLLDETKLGLKLYFEESEETIKNSSGANVTITSQKYIYFNEDKDRGILVNPNQLKSNLLIEGDNYFALKHLSKIGYKVDFIYIDPPYNTGRKDDFVYNDKYVLKDDRFKHSYWLSFMKKRLELAKDLLSDEGVILVSIDDNEQAYLKVLMDEIFGEENFHTNFIWQNKPTTSNDKRGISTQTENILMYVKSSENFIFNRRPLTEEQANKYYKNPDNDPRGPWTSAQLFKKKNPKTYDVVSPTGVVFNRPWNYNEDGFEKLNIDGRIWWGKNNDSTPRKKIFLSENEGMNRVNLILTTDGDFSAQKATEEFEKIMGKENVFQFTKPVDLIKELLFFFTKKDSIILDFFAGTGTTGDAVMKINKEDNGERRFVLVTNNENNIAEKITYERLHRTITGKSTNEQDISENLKCPPYNQNLKYIKLKYMDKFDGNVNDLNLNREIYSKEFDVNLTIELIADD